MKTFERQPIYSLYSGNGRYWYGTQNNILETTILTRDISFICPSQNEPTLGEALDYIRQRADEHETALLKAMSIIDKHDVDGRAGYTIRLAFQGEKTPTKQQMKEIMKDVEKWYTDHGYTIR